MVKRNNWGKKKHYKSQSKNNKSSGLFTSEVSNPLANFSAEEIGQIYLEMSLSSASYFNESFAKLKTAIVRIQVMGVEEKKKYR